MSTQDLALVRQAWRRYMESDSLDVNALRPEVASSWQRCHNLKVDPRSDLATGRIDDTELRQRLTQRDLLIRLARPTMERLYAFVKGTGFEVVLTDETGYLLDVLGDDEILARSEQVQLCPGGNWSEASKGTNAIGMAIFERRPVQVFATEHYCERNHFLVCSASPIFDADGQMVGVLDISGDYHFATPHTLGMVVAAVGAIENQLRLRKATAGLYTAYKYSNAVVESMTDGVISVDTRGLVTGLNSKGAQILGVDPNASRGLHISQVFRFTPPLVGLLSGARSYENREVPLKSGTKLRSSASLLRDDDGSVIGAVAVFREETRLTPVAKGRPQTRYAFDDIVGSGRAMTELKAWAKQAAATPSTILIEGESGTGKELFAHAIHAESDRRTAPFIALNCAALPEALIESELFGYEEGAFTGARKGGSVGKFELADRGTLFLDEIGDMPAAVQMKVLRAIQERRVSRVGSSKEREVDIRIIAATHKDLKKEVEAGRFRQDLYYRLHVVDIRIPALREHPEDIPELARHLVEKISERLGVGTFCVEHNFLEALKNYSWPGNIRELENAIERAIIRSMSDHVLSADRLELGTPGELAKEKPEPTAAELKSLRQSEREMIVTTLSFYNGNVQKTAAKLGIGRNTLYRKMREYDLLESGR